MTVIETVLVYVGIPAAIIAAVALVIMAPAMTRQPNRYRPGREWTHEAQWFVPHAAPAHAAPGSVEGGSPANTAPVGGASGEW